MPKTSRSETDRPAGGAVLSGGVKRRVRPYAEPVGRLAFLAAPIGLCATAAIALWVFVGHDWNLKQQIGGCLLAAVLGIAAGLAAKRVLR